jgi:hypothetical protein
VRLRAKRVSGAVRCAGLGARGGAMQLEASASVSSHRGGAPGVELQLGGAVKGAAVEAR